jgi:hypothetical protein
MKVACLPQTVREQRTNLNLWLPAFCGPLNRAFVPGAATACPPGQFLAAAEVESAGACSLKFHYAGCAALLFGEEKENESSFSIRAAGHGRTDLVPWCR